MSGFKEDVITILDINHILQKESVGWVVSQHTTPNTSDLYNHLLINNFPITNKSEKSVFFFDYIVIDHTNFSLPNFIKALSLVTTGGVIVIEIAEDYFEKRYYSVFGNFSVTKVKYEDRKYLVVKQGMDYGD